MVSSTLERHAQSILVLVLVALLVWVGSTTQQTAISVAQLQIQVTQLQVEVRRPETKFVDLEKRLDQIDRSLQELKNHTHDQ